MRKFQIKSLICSWLAYNFDIIPTASTLTFQTDVSIREESNFYLCMMISYNNNKGINYSAVVQGRWERVS